jgi:hypothetical protein
MRCARQRCRAARGNDSNIASPFTTGGSRTTCILTPPAPAHATRVLRAFADSAIDRLLQGDLNASHRFFAYFGEQRQISVSNGIYVHVVPVGKK